MEVYHHEESIMGVSNCKFMTDLVESCMSVSVEVYDHVESIMIV